MSHASGITPSPELVREFVSAPATLRAFRVVISKESLVLDGSFDRAGNLRQDLDALVAAGWFAPTAPVFVLVQLLESFSPSGIQEWMLLQYIPDRASVRDKMLFASSKGALVKALGESKIVDVMTGSVADDMSSEGLNRHLAHKDAAAPLTEREVEMKSIKLAQSQVDTSTASRRSHTQGISFGIQVEAEDAIKSLLDGSIEALTLKLDADTVSITIDATASSPDLSSFAALFPDKAPRYGIHSLPTKTADDETRSFVFFYICPNASAIKDKMKYSSARASAVEHAERVLGQAFSKRHELEFGSEIEEEMIAPRAGKSVVKEVVGSNGAPLRPMAPSTGFAKPARPGRGTARVII